MKYIINKYISSIYVIAVVILMFFPWNGLGVQNPLTPMCDSIHKTEVDGIGDYLAHFLVFIPWLLAGVGFYGSKLKALRWLSLGVLFVLALEIVQYFLPYRGFNIYDIILGEVGLLCSYFPYILYTRFIGVK